MANPAANVPPQPTDALGALQADQHGGVRLWLDVTTSFRARSGQMNGTLRVEQSYAKTLSRLMPGKVRFCRYQRVQRRFRPVETWPDLSGRGAAGARTQGASSMLRSAGRRLERAFRTYHRALIGNLLAQRADATAAFGSRAPGRVLLLTGETWAQHDFSAIAQLRREGIKIAALCQDLIPLVCPQFFDDDGFIARHRAFADFLVRDVDLVIAISEATKSDILRHAQSHGGLRGDIEVIQLGADLISTSAPRRPDALSDAQSQRFVLAVSTIQSRKNFDLLYHLWHRLTEIKLAELPTLVIVGQPGFGSRDLLWQIERDPVTRDKIVVLHRAGDEELDWLYQNCLWTLYPSFYEGWGLPISESLAHGKYCLASNTSSLPEAGAGFIMHLDPLDFAAWREAIVEMIRHPERLAPLERSIRTTYQPMTWERSAAALAERLARLAAAPSTSN